MTHCTGLHVRPLSDIVHLAHRFANSPRKTVTLRVTDAAVTMGTTAIVGAATTLGATLLMFACQLRMATQVRQHPSASVARRAHAARAGWVRACSPFANNVVSAPLCVARIPCLVHSAGHVAQPRVSAQPCGRAGPFSGCVLAVWRVGGLWSG